MHIYALAGTEIVFSFEQEQQLIDAIADALLEDNISISNDLCENPYMDLSKYQTYIYKLKCKGMLQIVVLRNIEECERNNLFKTIKPHFI